MVKFFTEIPSSLVPWIQEQKMFWVATAPLSASGHVNLSPKGYEGTFHIIDEKTVWYEDLTGSGMKLVLDLLCYCLTYLIRRRNHRAFEREW